MSVATATETAKKTAPARVRLNTVIVPDQEREFGEKVDDLIVGQPRAKRAARRAYRRFLDPLRDKNKPIYSIINVGPSRTGKTLTAEALAEILHGNPKCLLRINGGDYMEKEYLGQLTGARTTLVGYVKPEEMGGKDENTKDPYAEFSPHNLFKYARRGSKTQITVVLIDEWEKACLEFNNVILAILDNGKLTLGNGVEVDFRNVIFVFTSNLGMAELERPGLGFLAERQQQSRDIQEIVMRHMKERTQPEFRNRIRENGEIVIFDNLTDDQLFEVVNRELNKARKRIMESPETIFRLVVDEQSKRFLLQQAMRGDEGSISKLKDVIQAHLLDKLGGELIKHTVEQGDLVEVVYEGGDELAFYCTRAGALFTVPEPEPEPEPEPAPQPSTTDGAPLGPTVLYAGDRPMGLILPGPTTLTASGVMMSELMFLQRAQQLKLAAKLYPHLRARYHVRLSHAQNLAELTLYGTQLAQELTELLGAELLKSETTYSPNCAVSLLVSALPGQIDIIQLRFPGVVVELDPTDVVEQP